MAKKTAREFLFLECSACGRRNYRTERTTKGGGKKLSLQKYCRFCRKHVRHEEKKK